MLCAHLIFACLVKAWDFFLKNVSTVSLQPIRHLNPFFAILPCLLLVQSPGYLNCQRSLNSFSSNFYDVYTPVILLECNKIVSNGKYPKRHGA